LSLVAASLLLITIGNCLAAETARISINTSGAEGSSESNFSSISANGRYVAFSSNASNLVEGDTNGIRDIFIRDRFTSKTNLISVNSTGQQANADSWNASISADGKFVAFTSSAANLVSGDTNGFPDIFVRNLAAGTTARVSVDSAGLQSNLFSDSPSISADGLFVAFDSWASNLVLGDTNAQRDIFVRNLGNGTTSRISVDSAGQQVAGYSEGPAISADGRFVAFMSKGETLITSDTNGRPDIFVRDLITGVTTRVSVDSAGVEAGNWSQGASISGNGKVVAFASKANNLAANDTNGTWDAFVHNRATGKTTRVSVDSLGLEANSYTTEVSISADARTVAFYSPATNLVTGDSNGFADVFIYDLVSKKTIRTSISNTNLQSNGVSEAPALSADGRVVTYTSLATNLIPTDTNDSQDVFVRDRLVNNSKTADIALNVGNKPTSVQKGQTVSYTFSVTNNGPDIAGSVTLVDIISRGSVLKLTPSQGNCSNAAISVCHLGTLTVGASATLTVSIKANDNTLTQQLDASASPKDLKPLANNNATVITP
jgi:uncharacterized repeat protein (TIGR01451 family)